MTASAPTLLPAAKAGVLIEALPYIQRFRGKVVVVKYGGNASVGRRSDDALSLFADDVVLMRSAGIRPVVVHGGGPQIGELMDRLGQGARVPRRPAGDRRRDLDIARMVLVGKVNRDIVAAINVHGPLAVGVSGEDAHLTGPRPRSDLGYVGDAWPS